MNNFIIIIMLPWASPLLLSSHFNLKKRSLHRTCTLLIHYLYIDKILLSNCLIVLKINSFLCIFLKSSNIILKFSTIAVFDLIRQLFLVLTSTSASLYIY